MTKELVTKPSALALMAGRLSVEPEKMLKTLKDTVFKNATESELLALVVVANEYGLNPLLREIYAFPAKGGGITPVVSIDGWISMVNRQPQLDGLEFEMEHGDSEPISCTCTIYIKGRSHPVRVTEYYDECFRATDPWKQMPRRMLRHKALKEAARVAFGFSGITDEDEANDIKPATAHVVRSVQKPTFGETERFAASQASKSVQKSIFTAETEPEIKARKEAKDTAPFGEKSVPAGASGDDEANVTPKGASVAPDEIAKTDEQIWEES